MKYQCLDPECNKVMSDHDLISFTNVVGKEVLKCRYCRGRVRSQTEECEKETSIMDDMVELKKLSDEILQDHKTKRILTPNSQDKEK